MLSTRSWVFCPLAFLCLSVRLSVCPALRGFYRFWAACCKNGTACDSVSVCPFVQKTKNVRTLFSPGKSTRTVSWCWFIHSSSQSVYLSHPSSLSMYLSHPSSLSVYLSHPHNIITVSVSPPGNSTSLLPHTSTSAKRYLAR